MHPFFRTFLLFGLLFSLASCNRENDLLTEGEMLFLRHQGASMPLLVRGNFDSDVILLFVHGGVGGTSANHIEDMTGSIEDLYMVAYWDQRQGGSSQGNFEKDELTIDLMAEDMQLAIELLRHKYGADKKVFALGHSWGVILGTYYLISQENQLQGAIFSNGAHSSEHEYSARMDYILTHAQEMLDLGLSIPETIEAEGQTFSSLESVVDWCTANDPIQTWEQLKIQVELVGAVEDYVEETYFQSVDAIGSVSSTELNYQSPYHPLVSLVNSGRSHNLLNNFAAETSIQEFYDFTPQMGDITLPVKLIWGKLDPIVGPEVAEDYLQVIGTPESDKSLTMLENSGHSGIFRENRLFSQALIEFVEQHR